jgi:hypothetical protein
VDDYVQARSRDSEFMTVTLRRASRIIHRHIQLSANELPAINTRLISDDPLA